MLQCMSGSSALPRGVQDMAVLESAYSWLYSLDKEITCILG